MRTQLPRKRKLRIPKRRVLSKWKSRRKNSSNNRKRLQKLTIKKFKNLKSQNQKLTIRKRKKKLLSRSQKNLKQILKKKMRRPKE